ncbi:SLOG family protein [Limosilactobacillus ingluviei]|uniref:SLOG family protein n=1 Tax=Limosilactobacillus ingluviei TaxID=148604 RepID=UPI0023F4214A|nr:SLOG family protein [Limosilactobacillus ingluviei]
MQRLWVSGYRDYELGLFDPAAPEIKVIKRVLLERIGTWLDQQTEPTWLITGPQAGVERWALEVGLTLKADYPTLQLGMVQPFVGVGQNWQPARQAALQQMQSQVDYLGTLNQQPYQGPQQLRDYQAFMLAHSDQLLLVFDPTQDEQSERHAKSYYDYQAGQHAVAAGTYQMELVDFDDLREAGEALAEEERERHGEW